MTQACRRLVKIITRTAACAAAVFLSLVGPVLAQDVTITTSDNGLTVTGRIVSYDGELLQLDSPHGLLTLRYDDVTCTGKDCPDRDNFVPLVRLSGAARMADVMIPALIEAFARGEGLTAVSEREDADHLSIALLDDTDDMQAQFTLRLSNTDEGFADLIAFEADVVMAVREVRAEEAERAALVGLGDITDPSQARIVGFDALVPIVDPGLGLRHLSLRDITRAFRGEVTNWQEIGGPDLNMNLHLGPQSDGQWQFFVDQYLGDGELVDTVVRHASASETSAAVAASTGGLGLVPYGETANSQAVALRDACGFTAVPQTVNMKTQDYALTEPLFLYLPDRRHPAIIRSFLKFLRSPQAQLVVRRAGFVDQGAVPIPLDAQGQRFANAIAQAQGDIGLDDLQRMVSVLTPMTRLSISFRFLETEEVLDAPSRSNLLALGQAIRDGRYDGQSLMFIGFGAADEGDDVSADPSLLRAEAVKAALINVLGDLPEDVTVDTVAFGAALPMGCDDTPWGRQRNNRVELWVDQR